MPERRFAFAFDPRYRRVLRTLGVRPENSWVAVSTGRLSAKFGPWRLDTPTDNVRCATITGPYRSAWRAIGPHISLVDRGLSFGTNVERGVCVLFHTPVPGRSTLGLVRHPGLTVTVVDPESLAGALDDARGN